MEELWYCYSKTYMHALCILIKFSMYHLFILPFEFVFSSNPTGIFLHFQLRLRFDEH